LMESWSVTGRSLSATNSFVGRTGMTNRKGD
jgi:hypothetical protein